MEHLIIILGLNEKETFTLLVVLGFAVVGLIEYLANRYAVKKLQSIPETPVSPMTANRPSDTEEHEAHHFDLSDYAGAAGFDLKSPPTVNSTKAEVVTDCGAKVVSKRPQRPVILHNGMNKSYTNEELHNLKTLYWDFSRKDVLTAEELLTYRQISTVLALHGICLIS